MEYRVYLLDQNANIAAAESFIASDDVEAVEMAATLHEACSDVFAGFEVWRGAKYVRGGKAGTVPRLEDVSDARQDNILDLEDSLERSFVRLKQSRKLLEVQAKLREQRGM